MNKSDLAATVYEQLRTPPKDLYSERKTHVGCGECCSRYLPLSKRELRVLNNFIHDHNIQLTPERADIDLLCPLLSNGKLCMAYEVRPFICRIYNCAMHSNKTTHVSLNIPLFIVNEERETIDLRTALKT